MTPPQSSAGERYVRAAEKLPAGRVSEADWRNVPALVKRYRQDVVMLTHDDPFGALLAASYGFDRYLWEDPVGRPAGARTASAFPLRPVPSAGGLGSAELYLLLGPGHRIPAGAYHYDAARHVLDTLWTGDAVASLGGGQPRLVLTAVVGRVQWKYGDFGYRLQCLDAGVVAAQLELTARSLGMAVHHDPWASDPAVEQTLGLDPLAETVQAVLTVDDGGPPAPSPEDRTSAPTRIAQATPRTTPRPALTRMPAAHDLCTSMRAESTGPRPPAWPEPPALTRYPEVTPLASIDVPPAPAPRIARTRRSLRGRFGAGRLPVAALFDVLRSAGTGWGGDHLLLGCLVHNVAGLAAGAYLYDHRQAKLHQLSAADLRIPTGPRQLSIAWLEGDPAAAAVLVPAGDYPTGFTTVGDRWYRLLNLAAGAAAHRGTLAAHALGLTSRLICAFDVDSYATALRLGGGPLRPLLAVRLGPAGPVSAIEHRFHDAVPDEVFPGYGSE